jgi:hypothetical protein
MILRLAAQSAAGLPVVDARPREAHSVACDPRPAQQLEP